MTNTILYDRKGCEKAIRIYRQTSHDKTLRIQTRRYAEIYLDAYRSIHLRHTGEFFKGDE